MSDIPGPSPEEMGISQSGNRESRIGEQFNSFVQRTMNERKERIEKEDQESSRDRKNFPRSVELKGIEEENKFLIAEHFDPGPNFTDRRVDREYYGIHQDENGEAVFTITAKSIIDDDQRIPAREVSLLKYGRQSREEGAPIETEAIGYDQIIEDDGTIDNDSSTLRYALYNLKGEAASSDSAESHVGVDYGFDGSLKDLKVFHRDLDNIDKFLVPERRSLYTDPCIIGVAEGRLDFSHTLDEFKQKVATTKEFRVGEFMLGLDYDEASGIITVDLFDKDGKPEYKVTVPERVDVDAIADELQIAQLEKNPYQPANGVPGESVGDLDWRMKSFPDLIGVKVTPVS